MVLNCMSGRVTNGARLAALALTAQLAAACELEEDFSQYSSVPASVTEGPPALLDPGPYVRLEDFAVSDQPVPMVWGGPSSSLDAGAYMISAPVAALARDRRGRPVTPSGSAFAPFSFAFSLLPGGQAMIAIACERAVGGTMTLTPDAGDARRLRVQCPPVDSNGLRFAEDIELLARQDIVDGALALTFEERRELRLYRQDQFTNTTFTRTTGHVVLAGGNGKTCTIRALEGSSYRVIYGLNHQVLDETLKSIDPAKAPACSPKAS